MSVLCVMVGFPQLPCPSSERKEGSVQQRLTGVVVHARVVSGKNQQMCGVENVWMCVEQTEQVASVLDNVLWQFVVFQQETLSPPAGACLHMCRVMSIVTRQKLSCLSTDGLWWHRDFYGIRPRKYAAVVGVCRIC